MLWGPPGVGKSQGVRAIGESIEKNTGKKVVITDVRLLLFNPVDLRGIPTSNEDKTLAVWLKPKIFQMDEIKASSQLVRTAPKSSKAYGKNTPLSVPRTENPNYHSAICWGRQSSRTHNFLFS